MERTAGADEVELDVVWTVDAEVVRRRGLIEDMEVGVGGPREGGVTGCEMTFGGADAAARLPGMASGLGDGPGLIGTTSGVRDRLAGAEGCCEPEM